jgi:predicted AlkP superfamily phosphohydrolase/phosphomutase
MGRLMSKGTATLMIGLDAAEVSLIERWMDDGVLPNLRSLRDRGAFGPLTSTAPWLVGSPWPSFYTGRPPSEHGMYHYLVWRPERMRHERPAAQWLPLNPFWRSIASSRRVLAVDMPLTYAPQSFEGMEISGWATLETLDPPASHPPELLNWAYSNFGKTPLGQEEGYPLTAARLLKVRDHCVSTSTRVGDLGAALMQRQPWDLFMICFTTTHRAGHQLWDLSSMVGEATEAQASALAEALRAVYVACDAAIGRLVSTAGNDVTTLVFSLHGMGANVSGAELLPEMLRRVLAERDGASQPGARPDITDRLRALLPARLRSWIKNRLPTSTQDWLTMFWRTRAVDWSSTPAFVALCDLDGYIRINQRGREASGIVEPGAEFDALCDQIKKGLHSFVAADNGQPVIDAIIRIDELFPGERTSAHLPDLMVRWCQNPAALHRGIVSPQYGFIAWPTPGGDALGRSGNHRPDGFLLASGARVARGIPIQGAHILDLVPTAYDLLGLPRPVHLTGHSLLPALERPIGIS